MVTCFCRDSLKDEERKVSPDFLHCSHECIARQTAIPEGRVRVLYISVYTVLVLVF